eukprot:GEMP01000589.1.p1 GENE.GEMP01000589.1~~GEMP01000589.1.p1  ORF type:complete len:1656 (+),score=434.89 GEMP01000589.1:201-5168(+)
MPPKRPIDLCDDSSSDDIKIVSRPKRPAPHGNGAASASAPPQPNGGYDDVATDSSASETSDFKSSDGEDAQPANKKRKGKTKATATNQHVTTKAVKVETPEVPVTTTTTKRGKGRPKGKPIPKNVVSKHSQGLFKQARAPGTKPVSEIIEYEPGEVLLQSPPPQNVDAVRHPDSVRVQLSYTTTRLRKTAMVRGAECRNEYLRQDLREATLLMMRQMEVLHADLEWIKDRVQPDGSLVHPISYQSASNVGKTSTPVGTQNRMKAAHRPSDIQTERNYQEFVNNTEELPEDIVEFIKESDPHNPDGQGRQRFIALLETTMNLMKQVPNWNIDTLRKTLSQKSTAKGVLDSFLLAGELEEIDDDKKATDDKVQLSPEKVIALLKTLEERERGKFVMPKDYSLPRKRENARADVQSGVGPVPVIPKGAILLRITSDKSTNLFFRDDKIEIVIDAVRETYKKLLVSFTIPEQRYAKYRSMKFSCRLTYMKILRQIDQWNVNDRFISFLCGRGNVAPPSIEFFCRPEGHAGGNHLAMNFAQAGISENIKTGDDAVLPDLLLSGSGMPEVNGVYKFETLAAAKAKYHQVHNPTFKFYYNFNQKEWRIFQSMKQYGATLSSPTLYVNSSSQALPHDGFRATHTKNAPAPDIRVNSFPGKTLVGIFDESEWIQLDVDVDTVLKEGHIRSHEECARMLKNINIVKKDYMVTQEFRTWVNAVKSTYMTQFDDELINQVLRHEQAVLPFSGYCNSWYCKSCGKWMESTDRAKQLQHNACGARGGNPRMFEQFLGESFNISIEYAAKKNQCELSLHASVDVVIVRLMYALYWKADVHRVHYRLCKTGHDDEAAAPNYVLISSEDIRPAAQPKQFRISLKPKQLCTLAWMIERENQDFPFLTELELERTVFGSDLRVQLRLEREYHHVQGGILADEVGYGKTACIIALIASTFAMPPNTTPKPGFIPSNATLIIAPVNLFDQWLKEIEKFLHPSEFDKLKIVEISNVARLKKLTIKDIMNADVVMVPTSFFFSDRYEANLNSIVRESAVVTKGTCNAADIDEFEAARYARLREYTAKLVDFSTKKRSRDCKDTETPMALFQNAEAPVLEMFYYKRVVFDEFHEVMRMPIQRSSCAMMQLFGKCHWGLSGTPPLDSIESVQKIANFLHISVSASARETQHFINEWVRSNTWDREAVPLKNIEIMVQHTREERALYMLQKSQIVREILLNPASKTASEERLLQLCTHFNPDGKKEEKTAQAAVERTKAELQRKLERSRRQALNFQEIVATITRQMKLRDDLTKVLESKDIDSALLQPRDAVSLVKHIKPDKLEPLIEQLDKEDTADVARDLKAWEQEEHVPRQMGGNICAIRKRGKMSVEALHEFLDAKHGMKILEDDFEEKLEKTEEQFKEADFHRSAAETALLFFENTLRSLSTGDGQTVECSVCLDDTTEETCAVTACGHLFHMECAKDCIAKQGLCPYCRKPLTPSDVDLVHTVATIKEQAKARKKDENVKTIGSKMSSIIHELENVLSEEPRAKVIMFVQWERILDTLDAVLTMDNYKPLRLGGTQLKRQATLREFIDSADSQILLLSLEYSPTGMNLVCCHHVFLIHPMFAENIELSIAYEMQAIGRLRRQGQQHEVVVRRFVTSGTIEEDLNTKHHRQSTDSP